jgi:poly(A) polymerase
MDIIPDPKALNLLKAIHSAAEKKGTDVFLVGGYLRDIIIGRSKENPDLDFCLPDGSIRFARSLRSKIKAGFVVLDSEHGCARLVKRFPGATYTLDFSDFRAGTLSEDLLRRDFTINTLCIDLKRLFCGRRLKLDRQTFNELLTDIYGAQKDIGSRIIRVPYKDSFNDDPLRILRAFSLSAVFGFKIHPDTLKLIKKEKDKLSTVSCERIRDEIFKIFDSPSAYPLLKLMDDYSIISLIFPEIDQMRGVRQGPYHHLDVWKHSLETVRQLEEFIKKNKNETINAYLNQAISADRKRLGLMKFASWLHDIGKPRAKRKKANKTMFHGHERVGSDITKEICRRLKLSNDEINALHKMIFWHLRPGYLADNKQISPRARFRYFRDTGPEGVSTLILSIADQRSTRGPLTSETERRHHERVVMKLIEDYFKKSGEVRRARLVNGNDIMKRFKLQPSPLIGKILSEIEEQQAIGKIKNKTGALKAAEKILKKFSGIGKRRSHVFAGN